MEGHRKKLQRDSNENCHRCRHFLSIPCFIILIFLAERVSEEKSRKKMSSLSTASASEKEQRRTLHSNSNNDNDVGAKEKEEADAASPEEQLCRVLFNILMKNNDNDTNEASGDCDAIRAATALLRPQRSSHSLTVPNYKRLIRALEETVAKNEEEEEEPSGMWMVPEDKSLTALSRKDCPICFLPLPFDLNRMKYNLCCGQFVCDGCIFKSAMSLGRLTILKGPSPSDLALNHIEHAPCAFCCSSKCFNSDEEQLALLLERVEQKQNDASAMCVLANWYDRSDHYEKWFESITYAAELGSCEAAYDLGMRVYEGEQQQTLLEQAARGGHIEARYELHRFYATTDSCKAAHHVKIAACAGHDEALATVKQFYIEAVISKEDFATALRSHQSAHDERRSSDRDIAKEFDTNKPLNPSVLEVIKRRITAS